MSQGYRFEGGAIQYYELPEDPLVLQGQHRQANERLLERESKTKQCVKSIQHVTAGLAEATHR